MAGRSVRRANGEEIVRKGQCRHFRNRWPSCCGRFSRMDGTVGSDWFLYQWTLVNKPKHLGAHPSLATRVVAICVNGDVDCQLIPAIGASAPAAIHFSMTASVVLQANNSYLILTTRSWRDCWSTRCWKDGRRKTHGNPAFLSIRPHITCNQKYHSRMEPQQQPADWRTSSKTINPCQDAFAWMFGKRKGSSRASKNQCYYLLERPKTSLECAAVALKLSVLSFSFCGKLSVSVFS